MQNVDEIILKTDVIELINNKAKERSIQPRRTQVYGETYVSRNSRRKKKINDAKKIILTGASLIAVTAILSMGSSMVHADDIRQEVNSTHVKFNPVGGKYEQEYNYDEGFIDYANDLNSFELNSLYSETKGNMDSNLKYDMEEVVEEMEENYLEGKGRGM